MIATAAGTIDLSGLRGMWPQVLELVKRRSRTAFALLGPPHDPLAGVSGSTVQLSYANTNIGRLFFAHGGAHADVLAEALAEEFGGTWKVAQADTATAAATRPAARPAAARDPDRDPWDEPPAPVVEAAPAPAEHPGFAPGDEPSIEDDSDDVPPDEAPALRGEDFAVDLLRSSMGAVVVGQLDNT